MTTDNFCFYLQNRLIQTSQTGGQRYSDTSLFSISWLYQTVVLSGIMLSVILLNATMLRGILLSAVMLNALMLTVIRCNTFGLISLDGDFLLSLLENLEIN